MNPQHFKHILDQVPTLDPSQKKRLAKALVTENNSILERLTKEVVNHATCIYCQSKRLRKHGFSSGRQRFFCNGCSKTFVCTRGTAYFYQHKPELWQQYLSHMLQLDSIRRCAKQLGIGVNTAFFWRQRYLSATENTFESSLEGIIEADETYIRESQKGSRHLNRPARKRGSKASTPGLNHKDWIAVLTAKDRQHHEYDHVLKRVDGAEINRYLGAKIEDESILCTDAQPAYYKMCAEHHLFHVVLKDRRVKNGLYHIQNIHRYHSQIKGYLSTMHGVASQYLPKYLGWFRLLDWHKYQVFSENIQTDEEKFFELKLLQVQQHKFET